MKPSLATYFIFSFLIVQTVSARCLIENTVNHPCRYAAGDAWCKKNRPAYPYAYSDDCLKKHSPQIRKSLNASDLAAFADSNQITGAEVDIYTYTDEACGTGLLTLVDTFAINANRIGIITFDGACWGATYTYFEMNKNSIESIRPFAQVSAGRSTHFSNWGPVSNDLMNDGFSYEQLLSIARAAIDQGNQMTP